MPRDKDNLLRQLADVCPCPRARPPKVIAEFALKVEAVEYLQRQEQPNQLFTSFLFFLVFMNTSNFARLFWPARQTTQSDKTKVKEAIIQANNLHYNV